MSTTKRDYYEILGVSRTSTADEIKRAYRKAAVKHHPDKNPGDPTAEDRFKELSEAYDVLMDDNKRAAYDNYGHAAFAQGGPGNRGGGAGAADFSDIFSQFFGKGGGPFSDFFGGGAEDRAEARSRGSDLRYDLQITLEEAAFGCEKEIEISKLDACKSCSGTGAEGSSKPATCPTCHGRGQVISSRGFFQVSQTCPRCRGTGQIISNPCKACHGEGRREGTSRIKLKIPAGIEDGSRLRSSRNGEAGVRGGPPGDLYVVIHIKQHPIFEREEDNLYTEIPISFTTAALGGEVIVPTLEGKASVKIPAGTQGGTLFKLRGKGVPTLSSSQRGDLLVRVMVEVPTKLNSEQRGKLEEFAALCGEENTPIHKSFFEKAKDFFR